MYSNMCVKIALCVALIACVNGRVIRPKVVPLPPEGITIEIAVKSRGPKPDLISTMNIEIDERNKKVIFPSFEQREHSHTVHPPKEVLPTIGSRNGIRVGTCPTGYTKVGNLCVPDDYY